MARAREASGNMEIITPGERRRGWFGSFMITVLVLIVIAMVTVFFAVRTAGGRTFIQDRLGRHLGLDVTIEHARIGWPYALVLEGLAAVDADERDVLDAREIRLWFDWRVRRHIVVDRGELRLHPNPQGEWTPAYFARMGDLPERDLAWLSRLTEGFHQRVILSLEDCVIRWADANGVQAALASGVNFEMVPVRIPGHTLSYYRLAVYKGLRETTPVEEMEREWLAGATVGYLPLERKPEAEGDERWPAGDTGPGDAGHD
jgi:hypothetical protein